MDIGKDALKNELEKEVDGTKGRNDMVAGLYVRDAKFR